MKFHKEHGSGSGHCTFTLEYVKNSFVDFDLTNEWVSIFKSNEYNWINFTLIRIYFESSPYKNSREIDLSFLGFCCCITFYTSTGNEDTFEVQ